MGKCGSSQTRLQSAEHKRRRDCFGAQTGFAFLLIGLTISLLVTQTGCTMWRTLPFVRYKTSTVPEEILRYYDYPKVEHTAQILKEEDRKRYIFRQVEFPLELPEDLWTKPRHEWEKEVIEIKKTNEKEARDRSLHYTNRIDLYLPKKEGKKPAVVISPILGGNMVVDIFAKYFAKRGYVAIIVHRKKTFWDESQETKQIEQYLRSSIIRLRQSIDWLEREPYVNPDQLFGLGVSYGAILHTVLAAVEPRLKYHILAMPGGPLPEVIMNCPDAGVKKLVTKLEKAGWSREKIYTELKREIKTDPIYFAPYVPKDRVLVLLALFDKIVGASHTYQLWHAMDRPKLKVIPLGHYGGLLVFPYLASTSISHFNAQFRGRFSRNFI